MVSPDMPVPARHQLRIVVAGHVDHGKSTLIGRLLHDTGSLPEGKAEELRAISEKRGMPLEWSFVLDSFQAERDQAVTIDTTQIWFRTRTRDVVIIDAPGHREFLKNMISGAAAADAAVLVVDAVEGLRDQTRRHAYLLRLLGVRQVAVVINKMDAVGYSAARFGDLSRAVEQYLAGIGVTALAILPISARHGEGIMSFPAGLGWYDGPALLEVLERFHPARPAVDRPLRFPVQDVYRIDERRIVVGRVESGILRVGDRLVFSPAGRSARVAAIEVYGAPPPLEVRAGQVAGFTLDEPIFVERGDLASHEDGPPQLTDVVRVNLFWFGSRPLETGARYTVKLATHRAAVTVQSVERVIDTDTLESRQGGSVARNEVAEVVLRADTLLALDPHTDNPATGRVVLVDGYDIVGGGILSMGGYPDQRRLMAAPRSANLHQVDHLLSAETRARRQGHRGAVVWLTGLSGAGKSTIAMRLEQRLFALGYHAYVLDGDNVRRGLNSDLGFSPADRAENIRRVGAVAALFADAGTVAITAFISPYRADRVRARAAAAAVGCPFLEVHVKASLNACERRDPKGLYAKARAGTLPEFTGISSPYEAPEAPDLTLDTEGEDAAACVERAVAFVTARLGMSESETDSSPPFLRS